MTRIDFYVLPHSEPQERLHTTCRLSAKAWQQGLTTFIRCQDSDQVEQLNLLLWSYPPERFLPHDTFADNPQAPIVLGTRIPSLTQPQVLINLAADIPPEYGLFERVIEIVVQQPKYLASARENFRHYRRCGYDPQRVEL